MSRVDKTVRSDIHMVGGLNLTRDRPHILERKRGPTGHSMGGPRKKEHIWRALPRVLELAIRLQLEQNIDVDHILALGPNLMRRRIRYE